MFGDEALARIDGEAHSLASGIRARAPSHLGVETFLADGLSTPEGVALMCLAEAMLRIPDRATVDALIGDKLGGADWEHHLGRSESLLLNASSPGLALTGALVEWSGETEDGVFDVLRRTIGRLGQPVVRTALDAAMRFMGEQFVIGETIADAIALAGREHPGLRYSFDMLGEAAITAKDAET